ncbi:uncharacterized protein LOC113874354 [Abrus precatorius]|uniref:Uncharacterized protein LOC113874354 n=1 Tax=Abrus precatorius TaxID=3816 RepID=A0A8B8MI36_ABRPR|nr:uncharacterized protein LOC113874354 [Abrus precatorius]
MTKLPQQLHSVHSTTSQAVKCDFCGGDHQNGNCAYPNYNAENEEVHYMSNQPRGGNFSNPNSNSYSNKFSQGWRQNQNQGYGWRQEAGPSNRPPFHQQPSYNHQQQQPHFPPIHERQFNLEDTLEKFMQMSMTNQKNTETSIKNLETQVGQLAKQLSKQQTSGQFSANTQTNPKEHCKSITTRSGKEIGRMPTYARFMKELFTKKMRFSEETVELEACCNAIIQKSIPQKIKDLGSFIIPVTIGALPVEKVLLDLGASINLMPLSMLKRIGELEIKPTRMTLQLADRSMKFPYKVAEDILVKVDKFVFLVNFVIMDMEEDAEVPLILGRSFMKTAKVIIDVDDGKFKVRVHDEEVNFNIFEAMHHPKDKQQCFRMDVIDELCMVEKTQLHKSNPLEKALIEAYQDLNEEEEKEIEDCLKNLESSKALPPYETHHENLPQEEKIEEQKLELKMLP